MASNCHQMLYAPRLKFSESFQTMKSLQDQPFFFPLFFSLIVLLTLCRMAIHTYRNKHTQKIFGSRGKQVSTAFLGAKESLQISLTHVLNKYPYTTQSGLHIPALVAQCLREILARGLTAEGIFRRSGSTATIHQLMYQWCGSPASLNLTDTPIHTVAGLLKLFLQHLEVPLIPTFCHDEFLRTCDGK